MEGLSPTDYAKKQGIDRGTVYRWIKKGYLITKKTPSGRTLILGEKG